MLSSVFIIGIIFFQEQGTLSRGVGTVDASSPRYRALLIGINRYQDVGFSDLQTPVADVKKIAEVIERRFGFEKSIILTDTDATESGIRSALELFVKEAGPLDSLLIYFAGHGLQGEALTGFWVPHNGKGGNTDRYISNQDIVGYISAAEAQHVLVISDSCFSGSLFIRAVPTSSPLNYTSHFDRKSRWALTSGNLTTVVDIGPNNQNSTFAFHLIKALSETEQGYITPKQISGEISSAVFHHSDRSQLPRCGRLIGDKGGSFVFWNKEAVTSDGAPYSPPWDISEHEFIINLKKELRNRQAWVIGGSDDQLCTKLEGLGMTVDCDLNWNGGRNRARYEIVTYCGQIRDVTIYALKDYLGLSHYQVKTHKDNARKFKNHECGSTFEITIRN